MSCSLVCGKGPATSSAVAPLLASAPASPASHKDGEVSAADVVTALQTETKAAEATGRRKREAAARAVELKRALECEREDMSVIDVQPSVRT